MRWLLSAVRDRVRATFPAWGPVVLTVALLTLVPYLQFGVIYRRLWVPYKRPVDRARCGCTCFDTVNRGSFEEQPVGFKHVYFNCTRESLLIFAMTAANVILWFKAVEFLVAAVARGRRLRRLFLLLLLLNVYPNFYSWWSFFIYVNERMDGYLLDQLFFCVSELLVTGLVARATDTGRDLRPDHLLLVASVSLAHVVAARRDLFLLGLVRRRVFVPHLARDLGLMLPDLAHLLLPLGLLVRRWRRGDLRPHEVCPPPVAAGHAAFLAACVVLFRLL